MKRNFFRATVESVLIYSSISWTLTKLASDVIIWQPTQGKRKEVNPAGPTTQVLRRSAGG